MTSVSSLRVAFCWVCCCSRMSCWFSSYLVALERSLNAYVYVVVNSFPATRLSRYHSPKLPSSYRVDSILFWFDPLACANVLYIEFFSPFASITMLAISAKTAQMYPKSRSSKFAQFAMCAHVFHKSLLFIINDLSSKSTSSYGLPANTFSYSLKKSVAPCLARLSPHIVMNCHPH